MALNLDRFLAKSSVPALREKAEVARVLDNNKLFQSLFQYMGNGQPVMIGDNNKDIIEQGFEMNPHVYAVVDWIASKTAAIDSILYEIVDEKAFHKWQMLTKSYHEKNLDQIKHYQTKAFQQVQEHSLLDLLETPNPYQSRYEYVYQDVGFYLLTGFSGTYLLTPEDGPNKGLPLETYILPTPLLQPIGGGVMNPIRGFNLVYTPNEKLEIDINDIMQRVKPSFSFDNYGSQLMGMSAFKPGRNSIRESNDIAIAHVKLLQHLGAVGILSNQDTANWDDTAAGDLNEFYQRKYGGNQNYGKVISTGLNLKWQKTGLSPKELDLNDLDYAALRRICNMVQLSSQIFNDPANSTYNNVHEAKKSGIVDAVFPQLVSRRDAFNKTVVSRYNKKEGKNYYVDFDVSGVPELQEDFEKLAARLEKAWWIKAIDKQRMMGLDEDPNMDKYFIPAGLIPYDGTEGFGLDEEKLLDIWNKEYSKGE